MKMPDLRFYIAFVVQGILGSKSTVHLVLLSQSKIREKSDTDHLVTVRKVEVMSQNVYRKEYDKGHLGGSVS